MDNIDLLPNYLTPRYYAFSLIILSIAVTCSDGLENPSFENETPLQGWRCVAINGGREPTILADCNNYKDGKQSLLIASKDPADIAMVQKIDLPPGHTVELPACAPEADIPWTSHGKTGRSRTTVSQDKQPDRSQYASTVRS